MIFDPLISVYDKQVFEREKFLPSSSAANRLLRWEQRLFQMADIVIADTHLHAEYYEETLGVSHKNIHVIPVSAEENLFFPIETVPRNRTETRYRILYYGSYLALHGVETIIEAVLHNSEVAIDWILLAMVRCVQWHAKDVPVFRMFGLSNGWNIKISLVTFT